MKFSKLRISKRRALALLDEAERQLTSGRCIGLCNALRHACVPEGSYDWVLDVVLLDSYGAERLWLRRALVVLFGPDNDLDAAWYWWGVKDRTSRLVALDLLRIAVREGWDLTEFRADANSMFFSR